MKPYSEALLGGYPCPLSEIRHQQCRPTQCSEVSRIEHEPHASNSILRSHAEAIISHALRVPCCFSQVHM